MQSSIDERSRIISEELQTLRESNSDLQRSFSENQTIVADRLHHHDVSIQDNKVRLGELSRHVEAKLNALHDSNRNQNTALGELREQSRSISEALGTHLEQLYGDVANLYMLVEHDRSTVPDPTFGGVDPMPSSCYDNPACTSCFTAANAKLVEQMDLYEQLRRIYANQENAGGIRRDDR